MSTHIEAEEGQIAQTVLMPGDPLRAKYIAETYLQDAQCYNNVRGMLGFTGYYKGKCVSVQGSGMGIPSSLIYVTELLSFYGVKNIIRIGSAGSIHEHVKVRDIVLASSACTTSNINATRFPGCHFAPTADFDLLMEAYQTAISIGIDKSNLHVGPCLSEDQFYTPDTTLNGALAKHGVLAVEMEAAGMYSIAPYYGARALAILTISDHLLTGEKTTAQERERTFDDMMKIALEML